MAAFRTVANRVGIFLGRDLWRPRRGFVHALFQLLRMAVISVRGVITSDVSTLASALTYKFFFGIVPLIAVLLAFFKAYGLAAKGGATLKDFVLRNMTPNLGRDLAAQVDRLINTIDATAVGVVGFIVFLYTAFSLLGSVEAAFNRIWGIGEMRPVSRRIILYWCLMTFGTLFIALSLTASTFVQSQPLYLWIVGHSSLLGRVILKGAPLIFSWTIFAAMYLTLPNTRVPWKAALVGAFAAGTGWEIMKNVYVWYTSRAFAASEIYGSLSFIPILLLWIYVSWMIVLLGAELAFAVEHERTYQRDTSRARLKPSDRERLALIVAVQAVRSFEAGELPPTAESIATSADMPIRVVHEVSEQLIARSILRAVAIDKKDPGYVPARAPESVTARDVVFAIRAFGDELPPSQYTNGIFHLIEQAEERFSVELERKTLKELAEHSLVHAPPPSHR